MYFSDPYRDFTKTAKATGLENVDPERPLPSLLTLKEMNSLPV